MMFETYPFRVGLMGMLTSQYLTVYVINVLYFITTACIYGYRVVSERYILFQKSCVSPASNMLVDKSTPT